MKVSKLAKELGVSCDDVLEELHRLYVDAEDENSSVDDKIVGLIRLKLGGSSIAKKPAKAKKPAAPKAKAKKAAKKEAEKKEEEKPAEEEKKAKKAAEKEKEEVKAEEAVKEEPVAAEPEAPIVEPLAEAEKMQQADNKPTVIRRSKSRAVIEIIERASDAEKTEKDKTKTVPVVEIIDKTGKVKGRPGKIARGARPRLRGPVKKRTVVSAPKQPAERKGVQKMEMEVPVSIKAMAPRINTKPNLIIQYLMGQGMLVNINQELEEDIARDVMAHFGYELELPQTIASIEQELVGEAEEEGKTVMETRAPVVTFMGHVDHGKTSLLDYIRKTMVTKGEKGGITQHIGAYKVATAKGAVTFLDTPGHAAFTAMRARGANATDVVVLVVAADDGVMPQTKEAIDHARAANVPIVVAINKCDLAGADPGMVKQELQKEGLVAEDWGGEAIMAEVSAQTGEGVDHLVEMLMLESEMLELKANPALRARGVVIEGKKTPGQGIVVSLLVKNGTLRPGDIILCGSFFGKVKAMMNDVGERVAAAPPATPVEILGLQGVPEAGEEFFVVKDEKRARTLSLLKQNEDKRRGMAGSQRVTLEDLHSRIAEGSMKELKIVLKADVQGSVEALKQSLEDLSTSEVKVNIIHDAVGNINESDAMLAMVSDAIIIGFSVKKDNKADDLAKSEKIDVHLYDVIYEAIADVKAGMEGLLEPELKEVFQGRAEIRELFPAKTGQALGCAATKGTLHRKDRVRIKRGEEVLFEGEISSLKRFKDDVREVREGFEFGIAVKGFSAAQKGDIIETFIIEKVARRLER